MDYLTILPVVRTLITQNPEAGVVTDAFASYLSAITGEGMTTERAGEVLVQMVDSGHLFIITHNRKSYYSADARTTLAAASRRVVPPPAECDYGGGKFD